MSVTAPIVVRSEEGSVAFDAAGPSRSATWTVLATSDDNAREVLRDKARVERGTVYQDHQGQIPDLYCTCQTIDVAPLVSAPYNGTGLYSCRADFGYPRSVPEVRAWREGQVVARVQRATVSAAAGIDRDGNPIQNKVREPIRGRTKITPQYTLVLEWLKRFRSWEEAWTYYIGYDGKTNSDTFWGAPPECLLCVGVTPEDAGVPSSSSLTTLYRLTARLNYKPPVTVYGSTFGGWVDVLLHQGYRIWVDGVRKELEVTEPVNLNLEGTAELGLDDPPVYIAFWFYDAVAFRSMLPTVTPGGGG